MGKITSRTEFIKYCRRNLGEPVIVLNVDDDQLQDRVDEALRLFWDFHYDGKERIYYVHQVSETDYANKFITLPPNITGAVRLFPISSAFNVGNVFSLQYQIVLQDMWRWSSIQLTHFYSIYQYMQLIEQLLIGQQPIRYNEHSNRLYVDMTWDRVPVGNFIVVECFRILNPDHLTLMLDPTTKVGDFKQGETVTMSGGFSGTIDAINTATNLELFVKNWTGTPIENTTVTGSTSGATATMKLLFDASDAWNDRWLIDYTTALFERQWARNMTKFQQVTLPGGLVLNGEKIYARAEERIEMLYDQLIKTYSIPCVDMIG